MIDKKYLPYDSANTFFFENFLSEKTFNETLETISKVDYEIFKFGNANYPCHYIGNSIEFLHKSKYKNDKGNLNQNYIKESEYYNNLTRPHFDFLYEEIREKLSSLIGIPCVYHDNMLRPYIRTWVPTILGTKNKNNEGFHYDCNVLFINYENLFGIKPLNIISSTIILEIPEYSEFDYLPDSKTNDPKIYFDYKLNTSFHGDISNSKIPNNFYDNKIIRRNKLNDLTFQWNFQIHRIGKSEYTNLNQRRKTIQLSGIHDGEKIWLTS
jgi:hypothetical protein